MKRRWQINEDFLCGLFFVWALGWLPILIALCSVFGRDGMDGDVPPCAAMFFAVWFGVVVVPAVLLGLARFGAFMWASRPRRVDEPVRTDLREAARKGRS